MAVFPLDTSTLQSQILMNIRWKQPYNIFQGDATNAVVLPSAFDDLYMRVGAQNQISNDFALSQQLRKDNSLVYSIPGSYLQTYSQVQNVAAVGVGVSENQIPLTSQPSGQLQMILMSAQAIADEGQSDTQGLIQPYAQFETLRVLYNGIELYRADSKEEMRLFNCLNTDKDSGIYVKLKANPNNTAGVNVAENVMSSVIIIPFVNETSKVLRERRHEHTKNYSGLNDWLQKGNFKNVCLVH
jgi:hypothetical protein